MEPFATDTLSLGPGWAAFTDLESWLRYAAIFALATASGAVLAFHPVHRGRPQQLADHELRKTLLVYSAVGALIAVVCATTPSMALVIFGIGGLLRFRTDVGLSKHTGHAIIATLIGLCWGLGLQLVGLFATLYFWVLIYALERAPLRELLVGGVALADMNAAADAYRTAIVEAGGRVTAHDKNFKKQQMTFVFALPPKLGLEPVSRAVAQIPDGLRGTPHFPE